MKVEITLSWVSVTGDKLKLQLILFVKILEFSLRIFFVHTQKYIDTQTQCSYCVYTRPCTQYIIAKGMKCMYKQSLCA